MNLLVFNSIEPNQLVVANMDNVSLVTVDLNPIDDKDLYKIFIREDKETVFFHVDGKSADLIGEQLKRFTRT